MRKITQQTVKALFSNGDMVNNNTVVSGGRVYLHGNQIARIIEGNKLQVSFCGWVTNTTRDRIHAILSYATKDAIGVGIKKGEPEIRRANGDKEIIDNCDWYTINIPQLINNDYK